MVKLLVNNEFVNFDLRNKRGETPEAITQRVTNGKKLLKLLRDKTKKKIILQKPISPLGSKLLKSLEK